MNILISGCLLGIGCRYDGKQVINKEIVDYIDKFNFIPVCPEQLGGLSTPREPSEIKDDKVINKANQDVTLNFNKGANEALRIAKLYKCKLAILKERSPSCGYGEIYNGDFKGILVEGDGTTSKLLVENGIEVIGESKFSDFVKRYLQY